MCLEMYFLEHPILTICSNVIEFELVSLCRFPSIHVNSTEIILSSPKHAMRREIALIEKPVNEIHHTVETM